MTTPLLKFYLELGVRVDNIRTFFEYIPTTDTGKFSDKVIHFCKQGDSDPSQKCAGESWKLAGNSNYGMKFFSHSG